MPIMRRMLQPVRFPVTAIEAVGKLNRNKPPRGRARADSAAATCQMEQRLTDPSKTVPATSSQSRGQQPRRMA